MAVQELLQSHDLILVFDSGLVEHPLSVRRVCIVDYLPYALHDLFDFRAIASAHEVTVWFFRRNQVDSWTNILVFLTIR